MCFSDFVHEGQRPYVCPVLDKIFGISKKHFQHLCTWSNPGHRMNVCFSDFVHEGQRLCMYVQFVINCLEFQKTISSTSVLGLTHSGHLMNVCFSDFVHEGQRLYVCPVCDKLFGISKKHFQHLCTWSNPGHRMNVCYALGMSSLNCMERRMASEGGSRLVPQMQANFLVQGGGGGSCNNFYGYLVPEPGGCGDKKLICHQWECEVGSTGSILFRGCNEARSAQGICQVTGITERALDARRIVHIPNC